MCFSMESMDFASVHYDKNQAYPALYDGATKNATINRGLLSIISIINYFP